MAAWGYEFYLLVLKIKFVSPRGHEISSISVISFLPAPYILILSTDQREV